MAKVRIQTWCNRRKFIVSTSLANFTKRNFLYKILKRKNGKKYLKFKEMFKGRILKYFSKLKKKTEIFLIKITISCTKLVFLPYELIQIFIVNMSIHIGEITTHGHNDIICTIWGWLCLYKINKFRYLKTQILAPNRKVLKFLSFTHPAVDIIVGAVYIINNGLIVT